MAKPRLAPIYERLAGAPQYHPMNAETFADWSLEAGDIVTVKREGTGYSSPVHTVRMKWNGVPTTQIESVGEKKRESIAKMSAQKYARGAGGGGGVRNSHYQHIRAVDMYGRLVSGLELTGSTAHLYARDLYAQMESGLALTASSAHLYVDDMYNQMSSGLALTSSSAHLYVDDRYRQMSSGLALTSSSAALYVDDKYNQMKSGLDLTTSSAHLYVDDKYRQMSSGLKLTSSSAALYVDDKYNQMSSGLKLTSSSAALYVDNKYNQMKAGLSVTMSSAVMYARSKDAAAEIVARINEDNEGEIKLDAQHVYIGNDKSTTVINGKLNASDVTSDYLAGKIADIANLQVQNLTAGWLGIKSGVGGLGTVDARTLIRAVQIDGPTNNSYKLQYMRVSNSEWQDAGTFSRSISSASWSWAGGAPRVTLSPQGQTFTGPAINGIIFTGAKTWATNKKSFTQDFYCYDEKSNNVYTENLTINTTDSYNAGYSNGSPSSGTAGGRTSGVSALVHDFTIKRADGTTKTIQINVSNIYSTAREGYTYGTFTSLTAMPVVSSGGALYYTAGTASFYYQGNGTSGYLRGNKVGCYAAGTSRTIYKRNTANSLRLQHYGEATMTGQTVKRDWYYKISSGGTLYFTSGGNEDITEQGSYQELYDGNGAYVTDRGSQVSVLPVSSTSVRLGSSGTYYKKS